jgi:hypothetical protein
LYQDNSQALIHQLEAAPIVKSIFRLSAPLALLGTLGSPLWAHPGHGKPGPMHYVTEPQHGVVTIAVTGALLLLVVLVVFRAMPGKRRTD